MTDAIKPTKIVYAFLSRGMLGSLFLTVLSEAGDLITNEISFKVGERKQEQDLISRYRTNRPSYQDEIDRRFPLTEWEFQWLGLIDDAAHPEVSMAKGLATGRVKRG